MTATTGPADAGIRFRTLGVIDLRGTSGQKVQSVLAQPKRTAVLAYLAVATPRGLHRRDTLVGIFWPELAPDRARAALNKTIHHLRRSLGPDVILRPSHGEIGLDWNAVWCDAAEFERLLDAGQPSEALDRYDGELLPGLHVDERAFEEWLTAERDRLRRRAVDAACRLASEAEGTGDDGASIRWLRRALELEPKNERTLRWLLRRLAATGDRAGALREFEVFANRLDAQLDTEPSPETRRLIETIRTDPATLRAPLAASDPPAFGEAPPRAGTDTPPAAEPAVTPDTSAQSPADAFGFGRARVTERGRRRPWLARHPRLAATAALALVLLATAGIMFRSVGNGEANGPPASYTTIAVMPFSYHGGDEYAYLRGGFANILAASLGAMDSDVQVVNPRTLAQSLRSMAPDELTPGTAEVSASRFGAGLFVLGDVVEVGGRLRVTATLHDRVTGADPVSVMAAGGADSLFQLVDSLSARLIDAADLEPELLTGALALRTTRSTRALNAYLEGLGLFHDGRYPAAVETFHHAVQADTTFALAYLRLSQAANWTGEWSRAGWAAGEAMRYVDSLPESERLRVRAWNAYLHGAADTAATLYRRLLARDSLDSESWFYLGEVQYHWLPTLGRPASESRAAWERVIELDRRNVGAMLHLARLDALAGDQPGFERWTQRIRAVDPSINQLIELRVIRALAFGDSLDRQITRRALAQIGNGAVRLDIARSAAVASDDLATIADHLYRWLISETDNLASEALDYVRIAHAYAARGRPDRARAVLDTLGTFHRVWAVEHGTHLATLPFLGARRGWRNQLLADLAQPIRGLPEYKRLYLRGRLHLVDGDTAALRGSIRGLDATAASLTDTIQAAQARRRLELLRAETAFKDERHADARALLGDPALPPAGALPSIGNHVLAHERWLRAELSRALGHYDDALRWYETFPDPQGYDLVYLAPARLRRAELYRRAGEPGLAAFECDRIRGLLRDAEPTVRRIYEPESPFAARPACGAPVVRSPDSVSTAALASP